jgi:hypothetical protein
VSTSCPGGCAHGSKKSRRDAEERNHFWREPLLIQDGEKDIMVDGGEELTQVKGDHTSFEFCMPSCLDDVGKKAASIFGGVLTNPSKLVGMKDSMFSRLKLQPVGEHFLKHLAQCIQKSNQAK